MNADRLADIIAKIKSLMPLIKDPERAKSAATSLQVMEASLVIIRKTNAPCPEDLLGDFEKFCKEVDELYNKYALN